MIEMWSIDSSIYANQRIENGISNYKSRKEKIIDALVKCIYLVKKK